MFGDLFDSNNNITFNVKLAQMFGLDGAVYCSEVLNIYSKAKRKNKLINNDFARIDREYIKNRTMIPIERQIEIDYKLSDIKIVTRDEHDVNVIKINSELIAGLIIGKNPEIVESISPVFTVTRVSRRKKKLEALKSSIKGSDSEVTKALMTWFDTVSFNRYTAKKLSPQSIKMFQTGISNFAGGNKKMELELIRLATVNSDVDYQFAINRYNMDKNNKPQENYTQNIATADTISKKVF